MAVQARWKTVRCDYPAKAMSRVGGSATEGTHQKGVAREGSNVGRTCKEKV